MYPARTADAGHFPFHRPSRPSAPSTCPRATASPRKLVRLPPSLLQVTHTNVNVSPPIPASHIAPHPTQNSPPKPRGSIAQMCTSDERRAARRTRVVSPVPKQGKQKRPGSCRHAKEPRGRRPRGYGVVRWHSDMLVLASLRACAFVVCSSRASHSSCLLRHLQSSIINTLLSGHSWDLRLIRESVGRKHQKCRLRCSLWGPMSVC